MSIDHIKKGIENILNRVELVDGKGEESTKQAMILPMLEALGYDIWNPNVVCPEYEADTAIKKGGQKEKVDYAILFGDQPRIFIEVKACGENLDGHHGQLKRYFTSTPSVSLGILTDGIEYRFFTDTGEPNIQDDDPFYIAKLDAVDQGLEVIARFQKKVFSADAIREFATELTYTAKMVELLRNEIDIREGELSDSLIRWGLSAPSMYEGRITSNVIERFRPIAKNALQRVIRKIVRRSVAAIDEGVTSSKQELSPEEEPENKTIESIEEKSDINLVESIEQESCEDLNNLNEEAINDELECFAIVKQQFENSALISKTIYNPSIRRDVSLELAYRHTSTYVNIYFNKPSWWNIRLSLKSKTKWIGIDVDPELGHKLTPPNFTVLEPTALANFRVEIQSPQDLLALNQVIYASFEKTIADRQKYADSSNS